MTQSARKLVLGLSSGAWPLMLSLKARKHVDQLALTPIAASKLENPPIDLLIDSASVIIAQFWQEGGKLILVGAMGSVVRLIAPYLESKEQDPAVLVMDLHGNNVIPLIGGHKAGADQLACDIAADFGSHAIFTSDSKNQGRIPLDSFGDSWGWRRSGDRENWKKLMIKQARGENIEFINISGSELWHKSLENSGSLYSFNAQNDLESASVFVGPYKKEMCCWHPPTIWIGIGCERNTSGTLLERSLDTSLSKLGIAKESIAGFASVDRKSDEIELIALVEKNNWPIRFFTSEELSSMKVPNPSETVMKEIGSPSVAEASSLLASGEGGKLLLEKNVSYANKSELGAVTIAIAQAKKPFAPNRGELHLVGSGPGEISYLTNDARFALSRTVVWIGYKLYLDLLEPIRRIDQVRIDSLISLERERCKQALELANQGVKVALISSGDSGIYGMAGLALELLMKQPIQDRPLFQVHPGISAFQMAAAKMGAPLMTDFCSISLSDLLTPWEIIEERIHCAAQGDFVIAFYNPRSQQRNWQLNRALEILKANRGLATPIALARQLGRADEELNLYTLDCFPIEKVDMLSVVVIGNNGSSIKDGFFITPRGYSVD